MNGDRWNAEKAQRLAAEWRAMGLMYRQIKVKPSDLADLCEKAAVVMREANAYADEVEELKSRLAKGSSPKFAPFAPRRRP